MSVIGITEPDGRHTDYIYTPLSQRWYVRTNGTTRLTDRKSVLKALQQTLRKADIRIPYLQKMTAGQVLKDVEETYDDYFIRVRVEDGVKVVEEDEDAVLFGEPTNPVHLRARMLPQEGEIEAGKIKTVFLSGKEKEASGREEIYRLLTEECGILPEYAEMIVKLAEKGKSGIFTEGWDF